MGRSSSELQGEGLGKKELLTLAQKRGVSHGGQVVPHDGGGGLLLAILFIHVCQIFHPDGGITPFFSYISVKSLEKISKKFLNLCGFLLDSGVIVNATVIKFL
jgi:hypothetical protein